MRLRCRRRGIRGQLVEALYIASAEHHVIGLERGDEMRDHVFDSFRHFFSP